MSMLRRIQARLKKNGRAYAAVEFALISPVLFALIGGVADFGLYVWARGQLSDAVSYGMQYAFLFGTANGANANIASAVTKVAQSALPSASVTVTGPACYCVTGSNPPALTSQVCATKCAATNAVPGQYVIINANYTYTPIFPTISSYLSNTMYQSAVVQVQ